MRLYDNIGYTYPLHYTDPISASLYAIMAYFFHYYWPHSRTSVSQKGRNVTGLPSGSLYTPRVNNFTYTFNTIVLLVVHLYASGLTLGVPKAG